MIGKSLNSLDNLSYTESEESIFPEDANENDENVIDLYSYRTFNKQHIIEHVLSPGHYYVGVRNDDSRVGVDYRTFSISLSLTRESDSVDILEDSCESLKFGEFPWRNNFEILPEHGNCLFKLQIANPVSRFFVLHSRNTNL